MASGAAKAIEIEGLAKSFGDKEVLRSISLTVPAGESTVLIGPSATGKSVLLKCLLGLIPIDRGSMKYDGEELHGLDADGWNDFQARAGMLFQQNALFDSLRIWENVAFRLLNHEKVPRKEARQRALRRMAEVGLGEEMADLYPVELSGGMQKRVGVARAMIGDPELLILDDPTAGLDPILTNSILSLIERETAGKDTTVLVVTGDMKAARSRFDNVAMLFDGEIKWAGRREDVAHAGDPYLEQMINGRARGPIKMRLAARD
ncbi:MAG: ATP-binding cassette domain-containing protein [Nisaea sp.]|jgi:phospholipid/cholesterol/gamma-HCH transport system ATP-binding protein|uniref:ABC transporter ATP-binding protein n=1 Tax=Nisaea sp. TaxID=2024842 RepID=UPI001B20A01A|nr:ATP-binding cassette domain-containing protein [Nisaea sp.]MBO6559158.1 ATP-binding cassette domain-containing protein [Nisaea sp.]